MSYPSKFVEFFGPSTWRTLHAIAWNYAADPDAPTEEEQKDIIDFLRLFEKLLPCPSCRVHYGAYMLREPIDASSRAALTRWLFELHNDVNKRSNKPLLTYEQHTRDYAIWGEAEAERFRAMSRGEQLARLADPHMGRLSYERSTGSLPPPYALAGGAALLLAGVMAYRARRGSEEPRR
jgi:hypothetical protein